MSAGGLPRLEGRGPGPPGSLPGDAFDPETTAGPLLPAPPRGSGGAPALRGGAGGARPRLEAGAFGASSPAAREKLARILAGAGGLVTTGQQPVLFLGPLYVLYKALSAIEVARRLEADTGAPHLASFWIASDDHDWAEVGGARLLDTANALRTLRLEPPPDRRGRPVGPTPLPEDVSDLVDEMFQHLPQSEFVERYLECFQDAYRPGHTVGEAFGRALVGVLGPRDMVWLDAGTPAVKRASGPLLRRALENAAELEEALAQGTARVEEAGYAPALPGLPGGTGLFVDTGKARERLFRRDGTLRVGREGEARSAEEVLGEIETAPERFSPNVWLRPVLEAWLLPLRAAVLGPGETAYWAQLPGLFVRLGVAPPRPLPRAGWTVVEAKVDKVLEKLDVTVEAFKDGGEALVRRVTKDARPPAVERALDSLRADLGRGLASVEEAVEAELPGIRSAVGKARAEAFRAVGELEGQVDARLRQRQEVLVGQIGKAAAHLYPDGRAQERVLSPLYYLARYGEAFVELVEERGRRAGPDAWRVALPEAGDGP